MGEESVAEVDNKQRENAETGDDSGFGRLIEEHLARAQDCGKVGLPG